MRHWLLALVVLAGLPALAGAAGDVYPFESAEEEQRFRTLTSELRCPKCQNQTIADSNAPIAKDMRDEVYRMIQAGASNEEVTNALVDRFGEFVRYKPQIERRTLLLWATPLIAVLGGVLVVAGIVIRSRRPDQPKPGLSDEDRARAEKILRDSGSDR